MGVKLDRIIGGDPYAFWSEQSGQGDHTQWEVSGLQAKPDGMVYMFGNTTPFGGPVIRQYDARGSYRRTVFPVPAGRDPESIAGWGINVRADGTYTLRSGSGWSFGAPGQVPLITGSGGGGLQNARFAAWPAADKLAIVTPYADGHRLLTIGTDGALQAFAPLPLLKGEPFSKRGLTGPLYSALTSDGKAQYVCGLFDPAGGVWRNGQLWKVDLETRATSVFFALAEAELSPDRTGHVASTPYAAFHGVAVDGAGRVFLCDRQNGRVAVLDAAGKLLRSIPVANPDAVALHPKSRAIYVVTRFGNYHSPGKLALLKYNDWQTGSDAAQTMILKDDIGKRRESARLAAVEADGEVFVWVAYTTLPARVYRDSAAGLALHRDFLDAGTQRALDVRHMMVDQTTGHAYLADSQGYLFRIRNWEKPVFELCMQEPGKRLAASSIAIDPRERILYTLGHYGKPVFRWRIEDEFITPLPGDEGAGVTPGVTCAWVFTGLGQRGIAVAPGGGVATLGVVESDRKGWYTDYSGPLHYFHPEPSKRPWPGIRFEELAAKYLNTGGVRFDLRGNLYVGVRDQQVNGVPTGFEKDSDFSGTGRWNGVIGRIYRYAPNGAQGSLFSRDPGAPARIYDVHYGPLGAVTPRFGVDGYGRICYPTGPLPRVSVMDNEGNPILGFGTYGNRDSMGGLPGDLVPTADIPLAWPSSVDATDDHLFVSDIINVRLLRLAKTFAVMETVGIR